MTLAILIAISLMWLPVGLLFLGYGEAKGTGAICGFVGICVVLAAFVNVFQNDAFTAGLLFAHAHRRFLPGNQRQTRQKGADPQGQERCAFFRRTEHPHQNFLRYRSQAPFGRHLRPGQDRQFPAKGRDPQGYGAHAPGHGDTLFFLHPADVADASHPEECVARLTGRLIARLREKNLLPDHQACPHLPHKQDVHDGFADLSGGEVRLIGIPDESIRQNYLRAVRALRFSANYNLPIEVNTWMAILRASRRVLEYVSVKDVMDEWRKVEAENMATFVELLFNAMILHWFLPEVASLAHIHQKTEEGVDYTLFDQTLAVMDLLPSLTSPTIAGLYNKDWLSVEIVVAAGTVRDLIPKLHDLGAEGIIEYALNKVI